MRKLLTAGVIALMLVGSSVTIVSAADPITFRYWSTSTGSAPITTCLEGNYAAIFGAVPGPGGVGVTGEIGFCHPDDYSIYFGLEFFTASGASGYFIPFVPSVGDFTFRASGGWSDVTAVCISSGPNKREACASVQVDPGTGGITLTWIPVNDPILGPSGNMYPCLSPQGPVVNPTCVTCV
jgi:hypothetical protein